ncbi:hypothetical protein [Zavarzinia sp. CC-PAN008]|uniref:hypothetical protein n=1 Tax=Zavarzinia sp. CC-PAN008 TaxID=3243332 RepID=UPI003F748E32
MKDANDLLQARGPGAVAAAIEAAAPWDGVDAAEPPPPPPPGDRLVDPDEEPDEPQGAGDGLPEGCPVRPLGKYRRTFWYLDELDQLIDLKASEHGRQEILSLFGRESERLFEWWPQYNAKTGELIGFRNEEVQRCLMRAGAARGVWSPEGHVRGAGAWEAEDGGLILHLGDRVMIDGRRERPGIVGRWVYPARPAMPRPHPVPVKADSAQALLGLLRSWYWRRPELDPDLLLGWIGSAIIAGALGYRPVVWVTGDRGTGKSTLNELLKALFGDALLDSVDPSAAGIWQKLGYDARPVALDELEADADDRKQQMVIKLARVAVTGGVILRGGESHQGAEFTARASFLFSSILIPALTSQDRSRMAILELDEIPRGAKEPAKDAKLWRQWGAELARRMVDGWPRFHATLAAYRQAMQRAGHSGRGADQFGTLLACRDLLLGAADLLPHSDELDEWERRLARQDLAEAADDAPDHAMCLGHLLSSPIDTVRSGARHTLGTWIEVAARGQDTDADAVLAGHGLKIETREGRLWLAVANRHEGLAALFKGTTWARGVWVQSLRRGKNAKAAAPLRFGGAPSRATLLPLDPILNSGLKGAGSGE